MRYFLFAFFIFLAWLPSAHADYELKLKDGSALVWPRYTDKGDQYCTQMSYGEFCVLKSDVVRIRRSDEEADEAYRGKPVSEKAQKEMTEQRNRQDRDNWRYVEESQKQRMREEAVSRRKRSAASDEDEY